MAELMHTPNNGVTTIALNSRPAPQQQALAALTPRDFREVEYMASTMLKSGMFGVKTEAQAVVVLMTGLELGFSVAQSFRGIHVVQNRPTLSADMMIALCKSRPDVCKYFQLRESGPTSATYTTQRIGEPDPVTLTWTLEQAKQAGLAGKDTWKSHPDAMLRARAASALARAVYSDLILGLYTKDEIESLPDDDLLALPAPTNMREAREYVKSAKPTPAQESEMREKASRNDLAHVIKGQRERVFNGDMDIFKSWLQSNFQADSIKDMTSETLDHVRQKMQGMTSYAQAMGEAKDAEDAKIAAGDAATKDEEPDPFLSEL